MIGSAMTAVPAPPVPVELGEWGLNVTIGSAARPGGEDDDVEVPCDTSDGCASSCASACASS